MWLVEEAGFWPEDHPVNIILLDLDLVLVQARKIESITARLINT